MRTTLVTCGFFSQALFFVALGALVGIPDAAHWWTALQFAAIVILVTPPLVAAVAEWRGMSARASIEIGLLLTQTSEFSLLGMSGLALGHLSPEAFGILALATVITMTLTPFIGREETARALLPLHPFRRRTTGEKSPPGHVLLLGFGPAGMWTIKPLRAQGEAVLVVDEDAVVCAELQRRGIPVLHGDGPEKDVLEKAGAANAKLVIAPMRRAGDARSADRSFYKFKSPPCGVREMPSRCSNTCATCQWWRAFSRNMMPICFVQPAASRCLTQWRQRKLSLCGLQRITGFAHVRGDQSHEYRQIFPW